MWNEIEDYKLKEVNILNDKQVEIIADVTLNSGETLELKLHRVNLMQNKNGIIEINNDNGFVSFISNVEAIQEEVGTFVLK